MMSSDDESTYFDTTEAELEEAFSASLASGWKASADVAWRPQPSCHTTPEANRAVFALGSTVAGRRRRTSLE